MDNKNGGSEQSIKEKIKIEAADEEEARKKAYKYWKENNELEIDLELISVELIEERSGFLGFGDKDNVYRASLDIEAPSELEQEIEYLEEDIAIDGDFEIKFEEEGVMLKVSPPSGEGEKVSYYEIKQKVNELKLEDVDWEDVQQKIDDPDDEWTKIAPRKPELDEDASAGVEIVEDGLKARLDYNPPFGGEDYTVSDIEDLLQEAGVVSGIKREKIQQIVECNEEQKGVVIAEGTEPEPGRDAELEYHFEFDQESVGTEREDGSIDFFDRDLITNVEPGEVLVTKIEAEKGIPGEAVTGEVLEPPAPEDVKLPAGKNVEIKENKLIADIEGQAVREGNKVSVTPVHKVQGDLDLDVGNIDFVGSVVITGDVQEGFSIKAEHNIEVKGKVFAAHLEAGGGVKIHQGFIGKDKGEIEAAEDVEIKFVENGSVRSEGSVKVTDAIMHSNIVASGDIIMGKGKGLIVGGNCRAAEEIEARVVGSSLATTTVLEAGIDPGLKEEITQLEEDLEDNRQNMTKAEKALNLLEKLKEQQGELPQDKEMMYYRLKKTRKNLQEERAKKEEKLEELKQRSKGSKRGKIKVKEKVHPGVTIVIGKSRYNVRDTIDATSFVEEEGEVRQKPL